MNFKLFIKKIIPPVYRVKIKKLRRHTVNCFKSGSIEKTTLNDMRKLLVEEFCIAGGDNLIVSSSFGNLNADFSPKDLITLLQEIVGEEGNIVMPFYPPGNSYEWAESGQVFDMQTTRSSMGILTQVFSEMPNVYKSMHPTKAVVAWGKNAEEIIKGHENSKTPFYWDSPYGWLLKNPRKSLGLGIKSNPMFHACEDVLSELHLNLYFSKKFSLKIINNGNLYDVVTFVHDPEIMTNLLEIGDYIKTLDLKSFRRVNFGFKYCYCLDNQELLKCCEIHFKNGNFRNKK
jgi:aminoglycoside 3-N-acetyltransferase